MSNKKWSSFSKLAKPTSKTKVCIIEGDNPQNMTIDVDELFTDYFENYKLKTWQDYAGGTNQSLFIPATLGYELKQRLDALPVTPTGTISNKLIVSNEMPLLHPKGTEWLCLEDGIKYTFIDDITPVEL